MRRVVVTGLGAITPVGSTARETWDSAVAGRSGIDFIRSFDASDYPVRIAAEVKDFDPASVVPVKEARRLDRYVLLGLAAARKRSTMPASTELRPDARGHPLRLGDRRHHGIMDQGEVLRDRGGDRVSPYFIPSVLVDAASGQIAISLGFRGPNYAPVSACATGSHGRGGGCGADPPRRRRRRARGRRRGGHAPGDPRRLLCDARPRGRGGVSAARLPAVRRAPFRLRHG